MAINVITTGQVINLASNDVQKLDYVCKMSVQSAHILIRNQDLYIPSTGFPLPPLSLAWASLYCSIYLSRLPGGWTSCFLSNRFCGDSDTTPDCPCQTLCFFQVRVALIQLCVCMCVANTLHLSTTPSTIQICITACGFVISRQHSSEKTDERVSTMKEAISAMKVIKMHTWESAFHKVIQSLRM